MSDESLALCPNDINFWVPINFKEFEMTIEYILVPDPLVLILNQYATRRIRHTSVFLSEEALKILFPQDYKSSKYPEIIFTLTCLARQVLSKRFKDWNIVSNISVIEEQIYDWRWPILSLLSEDSACTPHNIIVALKLGVRD